MYLKLNTQLNEEQEKSLALLNHLKIPITTSQTLEEYLSKIASTEENKKTFSYRNQEFIILSEKEKEELNEILDEDVISHYIIVKNHPTRDETIFHIYEL